MTPPPRLALLLALILAGCASTPHEAAPPPTGAAPAILSDAWQAPLPTGAARAEPGWFARFNDPLLPTLIQAAQTASPSLAVAAARIERARAARTAAAAGLKPRLDAVASASHGRAAPSQPALSSASLGLQAAWEIDLFGAAAAGRDAAQARLEGAQAAWHDAQVALAAETASSYTALRACEAQARQSRADAESRGETARLTELSQRAGFIAPADAALVRAGAAQARSQALTQQAQCEQQTKALVELTALPEPELRRRLAPGLAQLPQPAPLALTELPAAWLAQRPDVAEAARAVQAAAGDRSQADARLRPQVSLSGSIAGVTVRGGGAESSGTTWSLGPLVVSLPLFDGGTRTAAAAAARAGYDEAVALYQAQVRRAVREVETSLVSLHSTEQRQADAVRAAQDFEASLRATESRQKGGLASLLDLETARRNALAAQAALVELQRERATAWISLYRALGGGFDAARLDAAVTPRP